MRAAHRDSSPTICTDPSRIGAPIFGMYAANVLQYNLSVDGEKYVVPPTFNRHCLGVCSSSLPHLTRDNPRALCAPYLTALRAAWIFPFRPMHFTFFAISRERKSKQVSA